MAVIYPNGCEQLIMGFVVNKNTPENLSIRLYANDYTPVAASVVGNFTEAAGGGYAAKTLTGSSWTLSTDGSGNGVASYALQTWTFTGALTTNATVYGYYYIRVSTLDLVAAERLANSFTPANNGDQILITPTLTGASLN